MDYPKFLELSAEIQVQVIRKCYPIPYARLRQSCRHLDETSEQNGRKLGIYCYRDEPHLYLTNTLSVEPFNHVKVEDLDGPHVAVAYGKYAKSHNFLVPMTSRNISKIRRSLSGFYFFEITLINSCGAEDFEKKKKFDEALIYFLETARDLNFLYVTVGNLATEQIGKVLSEWNARGITINSYGVATDQGLKEIAQMNAVKKMQYADYYISNEHTDVATDLVKELARGKGTVYLLVASSVPTVVAREAYETLVQMWRDEGNSPRFLYFQYYENLNVFNYSQGYQIPQFTQINYFMAHSLNFKEFAIVKKKYDIWLIKETEEKTECSNSKKSQWGTFTLGRINMGNQTRVYLCQRCNLSIDTLIRILFYYPNTAYPGHAWDYSSFYEKLENAQTAEEIKEEYTKLTEEMLRFYKKTYRRSILNVACELVTEWWNWPRWILEFTKRRPIEKRPPIVDLGYVLFQEILCPIYQYSTMPYSL